MNQLDLMTIVCLAMSGLGLVALFWAVFRRQFGGAQMPKLSILSDDDEEYWEPIQTTEGQRRLKGSVILAAFTAVAITIGCTVIIAGRYGH